MTKDAPARVLAVDDDSMSLKMLAWNLKQVGYDVSTCDNGRGALELMRNQPFDVVLLDCIMPEMDGYQVLEAMQADPSLKSLPVIVISGVDDVASVVTCLELGATDYLSKPFDPAILRARMSNTVTAKRARDREAALFAEIGRSYEQLRELESLRDQLIYMIVHDLRTPLTAVITALELLGDEDIGPTPPDELRAIALRGANGLLGMINDLLDVRKMQTGAPGLNIEPGLLGDLVEEAASQVRPLADQRHLRVSVDPGTAPLQIRVDRGKITRVLVNLLANAINFTPRGGEITLRATALDGGKEVELVVSDAGEGIPADDLPLIFDAFFQSQTRRGGRKHSTGLGLTFCKMAVEAHGGRIAVASELGKGTSFTIAIPLPAAAMSGQ